MTDREQPIELLNEATEILWETPGGLNDNHGNGIRADYLIANGVTVTPYAPGHDDLFNISEMAYCNGKAAMREAIIGKLMDAKTHARGTQHALIADIVDMVKNLVVAP